ncbi:hypothetical protein [Salinigranum marinum]|uniref:hypothetical protein n=1 Tax=Salinigranum marinum TaxID=1515595 RepID=UPI002989D6E4|nr:hypothetical protein [Salinigranum marinum]
MRSALERVDAQAANDDLGVGVSQLGGEVVNLRVADRGTYSFELGENLEVEDVRGCGREDATLDIETDRGTVHEIAESDAPGREIGRAYRRDDLHVEGVGTVDAVKWTVLNRAADAVDWTRSRAVAGRPVQRSDWPPFR